MPEPKTLGELDEAAVISIFTSGAGAPGPEVLVPNGDDAAAWTVGAGRAVVATTDTLVEGVHFDLSFAPPRLVGRKLIAVNVSDLAAMGAEPRYLLLSLCLPRETPVERARGIATGIRERVAIHGLQLIGGNVTRTRGPLILGATLIGEAEPSRLLLRTASQVGDAIFVTGTIGDARLGLSAGKEQQRDEQQAELLRRQLDPEPRAAAGLALAATGRVHACCDLSDGLGRDLRRMVEPAGLGAIIEASELPLSRALLHVARAQGLDPVQEAVAGGEDYELLLTAPPEAEAELCAACSSAGVPLKRIGRVTREPELLLDAGGHHAPLAGGFDHFASS